MAISGYTRCDCDWFVRATGDVCGECGHDRDQHNIGYGDECLAQEGDAPGDGLPEGVLTGPEQDRADALSNPPDTPGHTHGLDCCGSCFGGKPTHPGPWTPRPVDSRVPVVPVRLRGPVCGR